MAARLEDAMISSACFSSSLLQDGRLFRGIFEGFALAADGSLTRWRHIREEVVTLDLVRLYAGLDAQAQVCGFRG